MNELIQALIAFQPALAVHFTKQELIEQLTALVERLQFTALMDGRTDRE